MKNGNLNRIYRLVFNAATGMYVPVAEHARGRGKGGGQSSAAVLAAITAIVLAINGAEAHAQSVSSFAVIKPVDFRRNQASGRFSFSA